LKGSRAPMLVLTGDSSMNMACEEEKVVETAFVVHWLVKEAQCKLPLACC